MFFLLIAHCSLLTMTQLYLKYTDARGELQQIPVADEVFFVGRHSENDLCITDERLSRWHLKIERSGDGFVVSDFDSSNGTILNGAKLIKPASLKDGDELNLGGLKIGVEIAPIREDIENPDADEVERQKSAEANADLSASAAPQISPEKNFPVVSASANSNSISSSVFWLAPLFGLFILLLVGGLLYALSGKKEKEQAQTDSGFVRSGSTYSSKKTSSTIDETPTPKAVSTSGISNVNSAASSTPETADTQTTKVSSDAENVEQNAAAFLREIAQNDPKAFLTGKQLEIVGSKINQFKNSSALATNFKAVKKDAAQFQSLANSKNLKPEFLAIAALAKIGNTSGNPLAVAQTMLPVLSELKITLDNTLADDNLLIIAAYEQGATGKPRALQSVLEALSKKSGSVSAREIRTIWFLKENGKLTDSEFNFALQFLAIGIIAQNPKSFGVNADAVTF